MIASIMLVTTCPECDTTFRVTAGILDQAGGQVRCGRCRHIFDANSALREHPDTKTQAIATAAGPDSLDLSTGTDEADAPSGAADAPQSPPDAPVGIVSSWYLTDAPPFDQLAAEPPADGEADRAAPGDAPADRPDGADVAIASADVPADDAEAAAGGSAEAPDWLPPLTEPVPRRRGPYAVAALLLGLALALQIVHRFRDELVAVPGLAGPLAGAYAALGLEPPLAVDLDRYELLDLTAVAEPVTEEQGWLVIETRVQNTGPAVQPVPHIFVALLDRWQETIAGRYFSPEEYAVGEVGDHSRMPSGSTIDAQFIIVDPGPAATGFELQICAPAGGSFVCDGGALFE